MKRLGKYSGKVYEEHEIQNMDECGTVITDEQAADKTLLKSITCVIWYSVYHALGVRHRRVSSE